MTGHVAPETVGPRAFATSFVYCDGKPQDADPIADLCSKEAGNTHLIIGTGSTSSGHRPVNVAGQLSARRRAARLPANLAYRDLPVFGSPASVPAGAPVTAN
jgi:hypothetical protein